MLSMEAVSEHDDVNSLMPPRMGSRRMSTISGGRRGSVLSNEMPGMTMHTPGKPPQRKMSLLRKYSLSVIMTRRLSNMMDRKSSTSQIEEQPKIKTKYENSYRMTPADGDVFSTQKVKVIIDDVLKDYLRDVKYDVRVCGKMSCAISNEIKERVKKLNLKRYRIVVHVILGEKKGQGVEYASRCIWDPSVDNYACSTYANDAISAICTVHGIYLE